MALITCPACGNSVSERASSCPRCGEPIAQKSQATAPAQPETPAVQEPDTDYQFINFDRKKYLKKKSDDDPEEVDRVMRKWNWGAFFLTWIWGAGNGVYITLLLLIPVLGWIATPIVAIVLGAKGNRLSWESRDKEWDDINEFRRVQRFWAMGGAAVWVVLLLVILGLVMAVIFMPKEIEVDAMDIIEGYVRRRFFWFL